MVDIILHVLAVLLASFIGGSAVAAGHFVFGAILLTFAGYNVYRTYKILAADHQAAIGE